MCRTIVVTSGKGGVGKTTVAANLGIVLASKQMNVLLVDFDFGLNNLDVVMGVENHVVYDVFDVLEGNCSAKQALVQDLIYNNLYILPSVHTFNNKQISVQHLQKIIDSIKNLFDFVLIDCPAGMDDAFMRAISCADEAIVVTTPHISAVRDADKVATLLVKHEFSNVNLIVNRARGDLILSGEMLSVEDVSKALKLNLIGAIPEDDYVNFSLLSGGGVNKKSDSYKSFSLIANYFVSGEKIIFNVCEKYSGVIGKIKRNLRRIV